MSDISVYKKKNTGVRMWDSRYKVLTTYELKRIKLHKCKTFAAIAKDILEANLKFKALLRTIPIFDSFIASGSSISLSQIYLK